MTEGKQQPGVDDDRLEPGTPVEVFSTFNCVWVDGFFVAYSMAEGYRLRRLSDDRVLPAVFAEDEIRPIW